MVFMRTICFVSSIASGWAAISSFSSVLSEVRGSHLGIFTQRRGIARGHHLALRQHITVMRDGQRLFHILLDQQYCDASFADAADDAKIFLYEERRQSQRRFID